ncbi:MAG: glycosyltransferase [Chloroflexi bacterium]|nr:glycosyltransferase [Chloroflexota bacterium]
MNVYVLQVAKEFARHGNKVDVFTRCHDPRDPQIVDLGNGARVIHLKAGPLSETKEALYQYIPEFLNNLLAFQRSEETQYDLIHSHYWLSGRVGIALSKNWKVPHVTTFHTLAKTKLQARAGESETDLRVSVERRVMGSADAIIVSTAQERDDLARLYQTSPHKVRIIPAGVDLGLFQPLDKNHARKELGLREKKVILYVGRIEPLKGLDILLNAVAMLEDTSDTRLLIVGGKPGLDKELDRLKLLANQLGIADFVTFTGALGQTELPKYYSAADVFVLPSYSESFGLVALEAMACGTPVVVSRVGGLKTFVKDGETGYLIPWRCPEPFAQRIEVLLTNPPLREMMGKAAAAKAQQMSWSGVANSMLDFYSSLLDDTWESVAGA